MVQKQFLSIKLDDLIPYENNPRKNEMAVPDVSRGASSYVEGRGGGSGSDKKGNG